jgi:hypothetical protein
MNGDAVRGDAEPLPGSFRDPAGFVFRREGALFRQVNEVHRPHYDRLMSSGLYENLLGRGLLISHEEVDAPPAVRDGASLVLRPEPLRFVSYPYEWSFSQLRDAALTTLRIQEAALDHGMSLRDASAYNVQFHEGRPLLIDTLSFEELPEGRPWIAYRQFCQHFLAPLALMSYRDARLGRLSSSQLDGVPLDLAVGLLPKSARLRPGLQLHLFSHAKSQRRHASDAEPAAASRGKFSIQAFRGVLDSLRGSIEGLGLPEDVSAWEDYYATADHYAEDAMARKEELVRKFLAEIQPDSVWDLGANVGRFSRLATDGGAFTVAFDVDHACVDHAYRDAKAAGEAKLLPLVLDLTNPSPAIGWANAERATLAERGPADAVLALALVHHLAIANNVPLPAVADYLATLGRHLVIEFVPKDDEMVQVLLRNREDVFPHYTAERFTEALVSRFEVVHREPIAESGRVLFLGRRR